MTAVTAVTAPAPPCWCCATWGIWVPGTRQDQGTGPGWLCGRCAGSSPAACNARHRKETAG